MTSDRRSKRKPGPTNQDPERLRWHRVAARMSITDLAAGAGCSVPYLWQLEQGDYSASGKMLCGLAEALDRKVTDLMPADALSRAKAGQYADDPRLLGAIADAHGLNIADLMMPPKPKGARAVAA